MKSMQFLTTVARNFLSRKSNIDGRFLVLITLLIYFGIIALDYFFGNYPRQWIKFGVPALTPTFIDLSIVLFGIHCPQHGLNPSDPCFFGYPSIWRIFTVFSLDRSDTAPVAFLLIALFYLSTFFLIGRLNLGEGIFYALVLCSPPIMLLIERANVDILLYCILYLALVFIRIQQSFLLRLFGYFLVLFAAFLKIFPVFALVVIFKETKKKVFYVGIGLIIAFIVYYIYNLEEFSVISRFFSTDQYAENFSFGYKALIYRLKEYQNNHNTFYSKRLLLYIVFFLMAIVIVNSNKYGTIRELVINPRIRETYPEKWLIA
jgi:hypothetical protein